MVNADLTPTQAGEVFFGPIGASAVEAVRLLMIDAFHLETFVEVIPSRDACIAALELEAVALDEI